MPESFAMVACDIVGHSGVKDERRRKERILALNEVVRRSLAGPPPGEVSWHSGGDGGIAAFPAGEVNQALRLMIELKAWAIEREVPLRLVGHLGPAERFEGADGRPDLMGDGINLTGRLLSLGFSEGVVASGPFVTAVGDPGGEGARFHGERLAFPKDFPPISLSLVSADGRFESSWGGHLADDQIPEAPFGVDGWEVLYRAKKRLQANSDDPAALTALRLLGRSAFSHQPGANDEAPPLLADLDAPSRIEFLRHAQLIERAPSERICRAGDGGDTMFLLLRGEVGVVFEEDAPAAAKPLAPGLIAGPGNVLGELAFALRRPRTASLVALRETSLLAFQFEHFRGLADKSASGRRISEGMDRFIRARVLKFACDALACFLGKDKSGPLAGLNAPWEAMAEYARVFTLSWRDARTISRETEELREEGVYILVGGALEGVEVAGKTLRYQDTPILFVDLPGWFATADQTYKVEQEATILAIGPEAFLSLGPARFRQVVAALRGEFARTIFYDAFISYAHHDREVAYRWQEALEAAGVRAYVDRVAAMEYFPDRIAAALLDSLILMPLISANTTLRPEGENWVLAEVEYRKAAFEKDSANILPVRFPGGDAARIADGFTPIDGGPPTPETVEAVRAAVEDIRRGRRPPPFAQRRKLGLNLAPRPVPK